MLKDELYRRDGVIDNLRMDINSDKVMQDEIIKHITGMNRAAQPSADRGNMTSVPRRSGIQDRIRHAESVDREQASEINTQRRKEYQERVAALEPSNEDNKS